jgi:hypothetical protein
MVKFKTLMNSRYEKFCIINLHVVWFMCMSCDIGEHTDRALMQH